jgi:sortase A
MSDGSGLGGDAPQWTDISIRPYRPPRDWRWGVGLVGRILVATGLLLLGFVVYQLWGTGIQTHQAQNQLSDEFANLVGTTSTVSAVPTLPPTVTVDSTTTLPPTTTATTLAPAPAPPAPGDPVARMEAPKIGLDWIVVSGVDVDDLKKGPGHYPDTPLPGQGGNVGIAGHRTTYGAPFSRINELVAGDDVILTTPAGRYVYKVTDQFIVDPSQYEVLAPTTDPVLTLTSCHPKYSAKKRIIVRAALDPTQSSPLTASTATPEPATTTTIAPTSTPAPPNGSAAVVSAPTTTAPPTTAAARLAADQLERGWFDDKGAWPHVVFWALALVAVTLGGWWLARRADRNWVGVTVATVPFLVCLYFFYENVNRLLPPNI